jgi:TonB-dependent SusC/RagA subfamily outer membrane receptor
MKTGMSAFGRTMLLGALIPTLASACGRKEKRAARPPQPEQVSTGYGTQSRDEVSGSVASLDAKDTDNLRFTRIEELLQGRMAGVQVTRTSNGDLSLRIRGVGSFVGTGEPLYVVDGLPLEASGFASALSGIAPQDVARIDVLKDAGTTAIYGSRGANGVVLITTKKRNR